MGARDGRLEFDHPVRSSLGGVGVGVLAAHECEHGGDVRAVLFANLHSVRVFGEVVVLVWEAESALAEGGDGVRGVLLVGHVADAEDAIDAGRVEERDGARDGGCIAVGALGIGLRDGRGC